MKEELKQKMIGVIGTHSNALIESIAERCAQVAIDFYKERAQALSMSGVSESHHKFYCYDLRIGEDPCCEQCHECADFR